MIGAEKIKSSDQIMLIGVMVLAVFVPAVIPEIREIMYFSPVWCVIILVVFRKKINPAVKRQGDRFIQPYLQIYALFSLYTVISLSFGIEKFSYRSLLEIGAILAPVLTGWILSVGIGDSMTKFGRPMMQKLFWILFIGIVLEAARQLLSGGHKGHSFSSLTVTDYLLYSKSATESGVTSFVSAFFAVFFFYYKNHKYFILSIIAILISSKRIALLAALVCIVLVIILRYVQPKVKFTKTQRDFIIGIGLLVNGLYIWSAFLLTDGFFDAVCIEYFGIPPNWLLQGRVTLFSFITEAYLNAETFKILFGHGLGSASELLKYGIERSHVHSDILKNLYDLGGIGILLWLAILYKVGSYNIPMLVITINLNIMFFSDNIFIYAHVMTPFYICAYILFSESSNKTENSSIPSTNTYKEVEYSS